VALEEAIREALAANTNLGPIDRANLVFEILLAILKRRGSNVKKDRL